MHTRALLFIASLGVCVVAGTCTADDANSSTLAASDLTDTAFGEKGVATGKTLLLENPNVAFSKSGRMALIDGGNDGVVIVTMMLPSGKPDPAFGTNGQAKIALENVTTKSTTRMFSATVEDDGSVTLFGSSQVTSVAADKTKSIQRQPTMERWFADGALDKEFQEAGRAQGLVLGVGTLADNTVLLARIARDPEAPKSFTWTEEHLTGAVDAGDASTGAEVDASTGAEVDATVVGAEVDASADAATNDGTKTDGTDPDPTDEADPDAKDPTKPTPLQDDPKAVKPKNKNTETPTVLPATNPTVSNDGCSMTSTAPATAPGAFAALFLAAATVFSSRRRRR